MSLFGLPKIRLPCFEHIAYCVCLLDGVPFLDSAKIRLLLAEWFGPRAGAVPRSADEDYTEAAQAIRALKSLFQSELDRREQSDTHKSGDDRTG